MFLPIEQCSPWSNETPLLLVTTNVTPFSPNLHRNIWSGVFSTFVQCHLLPWVKASVHLTQGIIARNNITNGQMASVICFHRVNNGSLRCLRDPKWVLALGKAQFFSVLCDFTAIYRSLNRENVWCNVWEFYLKFLVLEPCLSLFRHNKKM